MRFSTFFADPPMTMGGCGFCAGFGYERTGGKSKNSPWNSAASCVHSDFITALAVAEQAGVIAQAAKQPAGIVWAEWWGGVAHHCLGDQAATQRHCERGLALAVELGTLNVNLFGIDQRIRALVFLARTLWLRGFADAMRRSNLLGVQFLDALASQRRANRSGETLLAMALSR